MEFFKKRSTAWAVLAIVIVCSFFIGQARQPADKIELLPSGIYVQDNANILSSSTEEYMTQINNGLVSSVGAEVQVVTINTVGGQDIFDVAIDHGMNTNLSGNSCVFLIAVDDVDAVIVQGQDLMYVFTDDELSDILQSNFTVDAFKSKNLDVPARRAFDDLISMYEEHYCVGIIGSEHITSHTLNAGIDDGAYRGVVFFLLLILLLVWIVSRPRRRKTVITPVGGMGRTVGRTYVPPRTGNYPPRGTYTTPPRYTGGGSSRSGGFGNGARGGSFSSGTGSSFGGGRSSFGGSSRSGGFGGSSRGGSFRSGGGSRGGGFRK